MTGAPLYASVDLGGTNVACLLARRKEVAGRGVLMIDWDLEAPGLHRYLRPFLLDPKLRDTDGLINMVNSFVGQVIRPGEPPAPGAGTTVMSEDELRSHARLGPRTTRTSPASTGARSTNVWAAAPSSRCCGRR